MLLLASILTLIAVSGFARSYGEPRAAGWAEFALLVTVLATAVAVVTFLVDGAALKEVADRWIAHPGDAATRGAGELITPLGFILVAAPADGGGGRAAVRAGGPILR